MNTVPSDAGAWRAPLGVAVHETAHLVANAIIGRLTNNKVHPHKVSCIPDETRLGYAHIGPRGPSIFCASREKWAESCARSCFGMPPAPKAEILAHADLLTRADAIVFLAGDLATARFNYRGPEARNSRERYAENCVLGYGNVGPESDLGRVQACLHFLGVADHRQEYRQLARGTTALLEAEWLGIVRAARVLQQKAEMSGDELTAVWRRVRQSSAQRRKRLRSAGIPARSLRDALSPDGPIKA